MIWYRLGKPERDAKKEQARLDRIALQERLQIPGERQNLLKEDLIKLGKYYIGAGIVAIIAYAIITLWGEISPEKYWHLVGPITSVVVFFSFFRFLDVFYSCVGLVREKYNI
jgi:sterol desaturase/sphingolipid hydroxylase (fatty acid hydroxylase superfamily)